MSIVVYYLDLADGQPRAQRYTDLQLTGALAEAERLRRMGHTHVSISSDMSNCVTKPGVDSVIDGKTPDGHVYGWKKRRI
jgi:hypothetical protein